MFRFRPLTRVLDKFNLTKNLVVVSLTRVSSLTTTPVVSIRARVLARGLTRGLRSVRKVGLALAGLIVIGGMAFNLMHPATSLAANDDTINFQARLMTSSGAIVPDGTYNLEFKLYNALTSSGSSQGSCTGDANCLWVEDYTYNGGSPDRRVSVTDGYLSVNLGSVTSFPSTINWNQPLYLGMNVGGTGTSATWDGEMTPRMTLTAIPYALMANSLATETGSYQSTLGWATQTASNTFVLPNEAGGPFTLCVDGDTNGCSLGASYIQNGTALQSSSNFNISGTGKAATGFTAPLLQSASGDLTVQGASGTVSLGTSTNLTASGALTIASGGSNTALALNTNGTGGISIGSNGSGNNSIQIGNTSGSVTQYIYIGNNGTSGSTTNLTLGSTIAGTLTLQDSGITQTFSGNNITLKSNSTGTNSTTAFQVENGGSASVLDADTTDGFVGVGTSSPSSELSVSGTNLQPGPVSSGNGIAASSALTVTGATGGNTTASSGVTGGTGAGISLQGGTGGNATTGSTNTGGSGGNIVITAGAGGSVSSGSTNGSGGQLILKGGAAGSGGSAGSSGSVAVESNGSNSTTAFEVQNTSGVNTLDVDTSNGRVVIGTTVVANAVGVLTVGTSSTTTASGGLYFGTDTDLYRSGSGQLSTGGSFEANGTITTTSNFSGNSIALYSGTSAGVYTGATTVDIGTTSATAIGIGSSSGTTTVNNALTANGNFTGKGATLLQDSTNSPTAFEIQNSGGTSDLLVADTTNSVIGIGQLPTSTGNALQVTGGITATTVGILVSAGGLNLSSTGITNTGSIAGATTYSGNGNLTLSGTNANELAVTGVPLASATSSLVQVGNPIASGSSYGTYIGLNAPSINTADFLNLEQNGAVELQLTDAGALTTGGTINGQTISTSAQFTGTLSVDTLGTGGATLLCENGGELATCSGSIGGGSFIFNTSTLQTAANIYIQSASSSTPTERLEDISSQTADLLDFENSSGSIQSEITAAGAFQGYSGSGSNQTGGATTINGGQGTGSGNGGSILLQIAKPSVTSGSSLNSLTTVATFSGATGSASFMNAANSTTAFTVQDTSSDTLLGIDTQNDKVYLGATGTTSLSSSVYIASSSSASYVQGVTIGSNANGSDTLTLDGGSGSSGIQIGNSTTAHGIEIGTSTFAAQTIAIGSSDSGSTVTLTGGATSQVINNTSDTVTVGSGDAFNVSNGTNNVLQASSSAVTIGTGASFGGDAYQDNVTNGTTTATITATSYVYDLSNSSATNGTNTETFNITGLPSTDGTTAFIASAAHKSGGNPVIVVVKVEINGTLFSTVTAGGTGGNIDSYDNFIVVYAQGVWQMMSTQAPAAQANTTITNATADYAEWIDYSGDNAPQPGDVLSLGSSPDTVSDSTTPYDSSLIGVVSTSPYEVGGANDGHSVVLALTGRVPVKVSLENGPILPGDPLTSSSTPGVAMKATGPGDIIGTALEGYDGTETSNEITVQLHVGYDDPGAQAGVLQGDQNVTGDLSVNGNSTIEGNESVQGSITAAGGINASGVSSISTLLVGNTLTDSGNLEVDGTAVIDSLQSQTGNISGAFSVDGNTSLASLLVGNDLSVNGNISVSGSESVASLNVSGGTTTQNLTVNGTTSLNGDIQLTAKINTRQATIKTFTASVPITAGSVVVLDNSQGNTGNVTTTTTTDDPRVIGVAVTSATAAGNSVQVAISGWVQVNVDTAPVNGSPPALVQPGQLIVTSSTAGTVSASASPAPGTILGKSTASQDLSNQVWILITLQ